MLNITISSKFELKIGFPSPWYSFFYLFPSILINSDYRYNYKWSVSLVIFNFSIGIGRKRFID